MSDWGTNFLKDFLKKIENMSDDELDQMMDNEIVYNVVKTPLEQAQEIIQIYTQKKAEMNKGKDWMDAFIEIFRANPTSLSGGLTKEEDDLFLYNYHLHIFQRLDDFFEVSQHHRNFAVVESEMKKVKYFYFFTHYEPAKYRINLTLTEALEAVAEIVILGKPIKFRMV